MLCRSHCFIRIFAHFSRITERFTGLAPYFTSLLHALPALLCVLAAGISLATGFFTTPLHVLPNRCAFPKPFPADAAHAIPTSSLTPRCPDLQMCLKQTRVPPAASELLNVRLCYRIIFSQPSRSAVAPAGGLCQLLPPEHATPEGSTTFPSPQGLLAGSNLANNMFRGD